MASPNPEPGIWSQTLPEIALTELFPSLPFDENALRLSLGPPIWDDCVAMAVINSFAEGLANERSDLDLLVILKDSKESIERHEDRVIAGRRVDMYLISESLVRDRLHRINTVFKGTEAPFVQKVVAGLPLRNARAFDAIRSVCNIERYRVAMREQSVWFAVLNIEDVAGSWGEGDYASAALQARHFYQNALDAYLCENGRTLCRPKWRLKLASRVFGIESNILKTAIRLEFSGPTDPTKDNTHKYLRATTTFARRLMGLLLFPEFRTTKDWPEAAPWATFSLCVMNGKRAMFLNPTPRFQGSEFDARTFYSTGFSETERARQAMGGPPTLAPIEGDRVGHSLRRLCHSGLMEY